MPGAEVTAPRLTGTVVHGYRLSGWRHDKHRWYRLWLSIKGPTIAASLDSGRLAIPVRDMEKGHACKRERMPPSTVALGKTRADTWLADMLAQVTT